MLALLLAAFRFRGEIADSRGFRLLEQMAAQLRDGMPIREAVLVFWQDLTSYGPVP